MTFSVDLNTYDCQSDSECSRQRCECDATLAFDLSHHFLDFGTDFDTNDLNLTEDDCTHSITPVIGANDCCGEAPTWKPYNDQFETCTDGELGLI